MYQLYENEQEQRSPTPLKKATTESQTLCHVWSEHLQTILCQPSQAPTGTTPTSRGTIDSPGRAGPGPAANKPKLQLTQPGPSGDIALLAPCWLPR